MMKLSISMLFAGMIIVLPNVGFAANDCNAVVTIKSQKKTPPGWVLEFNVKTACTSSTGRFLYTYVNDNGQLIDRASPTWAPADGKNFVLKDEVAEPGGMKSLTVVKDSIESTKNP